MAVIIGIASAVNITVEDKDPMFYHNAIVQHIVVPFAFDVTMGGHIMAAGVVASHHSLDTELAGNYLSKLMEFAFKLVNLFEYT